MGLESEVVCFSFTISLHTERLEKRVVSQPDTFHHLFICGDSGFGQNSHEERVLMGKMATQIAGLGRGLRVRGQASVSWVRILGDGEKILSWNKAV